MIGLYHKIVIEDLEKIKIWNMKYGVQWNSQLITKEK